MIPLPHALALLDEQALPLPVEAVPLSDALDRYLAQPLRTPFAQPPFSKSAMDGFAVRKADLAGPEKRFAILETVAAGAVATKPVTTDTATRIMTGAPIPEGADCVVRVEYSREDSSGEGAGTVRFLEQEKSSNIIEQGENAGAGDEVLSAPRRLRPSDIGVAASIGYATLPVFARPRIAILSTGDELREPRLEVATGETAGPGVKTARATHAHATQVHANKAEALSPGTIFNSNSYQLYAHALAAGFLPTYYGIVADTPEALRKTLERAFAENTCVALSGGVSKGNYDYVPDVLGEFGVATVFHRVAMKPGRPTFFGTREQAGTRQYVFGLPGNPVSTFVTFELFARRLLERMAGLEPVWENRAVRLGATVKKGDPERTEFVPVAISDGVATPVRYGGSSHLNALSTANALLMVSVGTTQLEEGRVVDVRSI